MRRLLAAVAFLTRVPVPLQLDAADVGRGAIFFPLVGALIGAGAVALRHGLAHLPAAVAAVLLLAYGALATGALHLDGLADMADGFGGGRTRDDVLRIMRDHAIGAYGATALALLLLLKMAALTALLPSGDADRVLVLAPALARWPSVVLGRFLPYARSSGLGSALTNHTGALELAGATALAAGAAWALLGARGAICFGAVAALSALGGLYCRRRIGGVTGDTLGANTELCEALVYVIALAVQ